MQRLMVLQRVLALFICFSFITQTIVSEQLYPVLARLTLADCFGLLALIIGIPSLLQFTNIKDKSMTLYKGAVVMVVLFALSACFSLNFFASFIEVGIILFLITLSVVLFLAFRDKGIETLIPIVIYTSIIATTLGFYDLIASYLDFPRIFNPRNKGELLSGFRNAGQAGAYFLVMLTILIPVRLSGVYDMLSRKHKFLFHIAIVELVLFVFLSGKLAAQFGLIIGLLLLGILWYRSKLLKIAIMGLIGTVFLFYSVKNILPETYTRLSNKYNDYVSIYLSDSYKDSFLYGNWSSAIQAFKDKPLSGTGLGAFICNYGEHEVHGTYFKLIGESGVLGILGFVIFTFVLLKLFLRLKPRITNVYYDYLHLILPLLIGCHLSWGYTYHLRKREFWILIAVILIVYYQAEKQRTTEMA